jgi:hypothetical protein
MKKKKVVIKIKVIEALISYFFFFKLKANIKQ